MLKVRNVCFARLLKPERPDDGRDYWARLRRAGAGSPEELFELLKARACTVTTMPRDRWDIARYWHPEIGTPGKYYTFAAGILDGIMISTAAVSACRGARPPSWTRSSASCWN